MHAGAAVLGESAQVEEMSARRRRVVVVVVVVVAPVGELSQNLIAAVEVSITSCRKRRGSGWSEGTIGLTSGREGGLFTSETRRGCTFKGHRRFEAEGADCKSLLPGLWRALLYALGWFLITERTAEFTNPGDRLTTDGNEPHNTAQVTNALGRASQGNSQQGSKKNKRQHPNDTIQSQTFISPTKLTGPSKECTLN